MIYSYNVNLNLVHECSILRFEMQQLKNIVHRICNQRNTNHRDEQMIDKKKKEKRIGENYMNRSYYLPHLSSSPALK